MNRACIVLAGGDAEPDLRSAHQIQFRSELSYRGLSFAQIAADALRSQGPVTVIGGPCIPGTDHQEGGRSFLESFANGLEAAAGHERLLMASADMPFVTEEAIRAFVERVDPGAALNYPIVPLALAERAYPGLRRTALRFRDGAFTGGNVFELDRETMLAALPRMNAVYAARKHPVKLAKTFGIGTLLAILQSKLVPKTISIKKLESVVSNSVGFEVHAVIMEYPEIAADIDNSSQYTWLKTLEKRHETTD